MFCHRPVYGRLICDVFAENLAGSAIVVAQIWVQILFKVAQFWMPFNTPADKVGTASVATLATGPAQRVSAQQQASALQEPLNSVETADKAQRYKLQNMDDDTDDRHSKNTFSVSKRR